MDFEHFYTTYYTEADRYVMKHIGNRHDAEDVLSDCFLYCYKHYSEFDPKRASERTWLYVVLKSRIRNYYRDRRETEPWEADDARHFETDDHLREAVELQELRDGLAAALAELPEKQRTLVILRYFYDCSSKELAERTGLSPGAARVSLSRALDALAKILDSKGFGKEQ